MTNPAQTKESFDRKAAYAIALTCIIAWAFAYIFMNWVRSFALGLFIWLPMVMGALCTIFYGWKSKPSYSKTLQLTLAMLIIFFIGQIFFAWEGMICLLMVAPISLFAAIIGSLLAYELIRKNNNSHKKTIFLLILSVPCLMGFEGLRKEKEKLRSVSTSIEVNASPEEVWKNVIAFSPLAEPTEFLFKAGIAYPIDATINGRGPGAIRYCNFSTGSFVEPITVWDEPRLLKFTVEKQPVPMRELSPYDIHPTHLQGYWISKEGQFKLTRLANGNTLLEGTTWYINKIKPGFYWTLWSDYIVHKIHKRVLIHIKKETEDRGPKTGDGVPR